VEIIAEILGIVLKDALIESIQRQSPALSLRQYRALILTCELFKTIVDTACVQLTIMCSIPHPPITFGRARNTRVLVSPWDVTEAPDDKRHCKTNLQNPTKSIRTISNPRRDPLQTNLQFSTTNDIHGIP